MTADFSTLCKSLAKRYKNTQQFEDLVSEGVVACYEVLAQGKTEPSDFVGAARRAMNNYTNVKNKAVSIPVSGNAYNVSHAMSLDKGVETMEGMSDGTLLSLVQAMANTTESVGDDTAFTADHAELFEEKEYQAYVMSVVKKTLTSTESKVIQLRYVEDMTQDEVSDVFQTSKMWVSRHERDALAKLRKKLCNNS